MHFLEGPDVGHSTNSLWGEKGKNKEEKAQNLARYEPMTSWVCAPKACALCHDCVPTYFIVKSAKSSRLNYNSRFICLHNYDLKARVVAIYTSRILVVCLVTKKDLDSSSYCPTRLQLTIITCNSQKRCFCTLGNILSNCSAHWNDNHLVPNCEPFYLINKSEAL